MSKLTWVEVSKSALMHNVRQFKQLIGPQVKLYVVVKSNAYGHGVDLAAPVIVEAGADGLAVNSIEELTHLRAKGITVPILVLGYIARTELADLVRGQGEAIVYNEESLIDLNKLAQAAGTQAFVHLKLETGTNRQGIMPGQLPQFLDLLPTLPHVALRGITTHFANIEDTTEHSYALHQTSVFEQFKNRFRHQGYESLLCHTACTAATILFPETYYDLVRVGIGIYGLWPSKETYLSARMKFAHTLNLIPALTWKTRIAQVKTIPSGSYIGYGCTYRTTRRTKLAVLPIGYYEGYDRHFSNAAYVLIHGKRAQVRGRICMNISLVDVTDIPKVQIEDEVVLLGKQGDEEIKAEYLAALAGTINYEIVSRINPLIPRVTAP